MTWKKFVEISEEIKKNGNKTIVNESLENLPTSFSSMQEAERFFRERGGITMEELDKMIMEIKNDNSWESSWNHTSFPSIRTYAKKPFSDSISQHGEYSDGVNYDPFDYWPFNPSNGDMPSPDAQFHHDLEDGTKWDIRNGEHNGRKGIRIGDKNPGIDALSRYFGKK